MSKQMLIKLNTKSYGKVFIIFFDSMVLVKQIVSVNILPRIEYFKSQLVYLVFHLFSEKKKKGLKKICKVER